MTKARHRRALLLQLCPRSFGVTAASAASGSGSFARFGVKSFKLHWLARQNRGYDAVGNRVSGVENGATVSFSVSATSNRITALSVRC